MGRRVPDGPGPGGADPATVDYVSLTQDPPPRYAPPVVLDGYDVDGSPDRGGFVYLGLPPARLGAVGVIPADVWIFAVRPRGLLVAFLRGMLGACR